MALQYSPMSEDLDDKRYYETPMSACSSQSESRPTSPVSPYRYKPIGSCCSPPSTSLPSSEPCQRGSDTEARFPSSPSDICHSSDLRKTALLRPVQMRAQPSCSSSFDLGFNSGVETRSCSYLKPLGDVLNKDTHENGNGNFGSGCDVGGDDVVGFDLVIPGVIGKDDISDLRVRLGGYGQITSKVFRRDEINIGMQRIWCEWLGKRNSDDDEINSRISSHDFAIVTFSYFYDLGKQCLFDGIKTLLLTGGEDGDNSSSSRKRRKESFSDSEINSETQNYHPDSSGEDSQGSTSTRSSSLLVNRYDDHLVHSRIIPSKSLRRELRRQQRVASEKMCDICQQKMIAGKDVATLVNLKTGRLACSSRNVHGAFHVFHTSCLIHWILLCEFEMFMKPPVRPKVRRKSRRKVKPNFCQLEEPEAKTDSIKPNLSRKASETGTFCDRICSVFCPDCQGTGIEVEGDELEKPTISLSEMFKYKIKMSDAHRAWMKCPEELENCSIGFTFPVQADNVEEKVLHMKLLHFYRADEDSWPSSS